MASSMVISKLEESASVLDIVVLVAGALLTSSVFWLCYTRFFHALSKFPGPFSASLSSWWLVRHISRFHADSEERDLHAHHGMSSTSIGDVLGLIWFITNGNSS